MRGSIRLLCLVVALLLLPIPLADAQEGEAIAAALGFACRDGNDKDVDVQLLLDHNDDTGLICKKADTAEVTVMLLT